MLVTLVSGLDMTMHSYLPAESSKHALDTVGDVLGEFLSRISKLLRVNMDKSRYQGEGFEVS